MKLCPIIFKQILTAVHSFSCYQQYTIFLSFLYLVSIVCGKQTLYIFAVSYGRTFANFNFPHKERFFPISKIN